MYTSVNWIKKMNKLIIPIAFFFNNWCWPAFNIVNNCYSTSYNLKKRFHNFTKITLSSDLLHIPSQLQFVEWFLSLLVIVVVMLFEPTQFAQYEHCQCFDLLLS